MVILFTYTVEVFGVTLPYECRLFAKGCTPEHPIGPCMVSSEGSCAAYYRYTDYCRA